MVSLQASSPDGEVQAVDIKFMGDLQSNSIDCRLAQLLYHVVSISKLCICVFGRLSCLKAWRSTCCSRARLRQVVSCSSGFYTQHLHVKCCLLNLLSCPPPAAAATSWSYVPQVQLGQLQDPFTATQTGQH